jgi:hypothetical protein
MTGVAHQKVNAGHLKRNAYLYVRQSTLRHVFESTEAASGSTGCGKMPSPWAGPWSALPSSTATSDSLAHRLSIGRAFKKLVAEVSLGKAGIVLGLEVSRLARNSTDWRRLLEICALTDTLILDQGGVYDPSHFNDRLLLGLKGTMSEAELQVFRARLQGGILNNARRGELQCPLPVGFVYNVDDEPYSIPTSRFRKAFDSFSRRFGVPHRPARPSKPSARKSFCFRGG